MFVSSSILTTKGLGYFSTQVRHFSLHNGKKIKDKAGDFCIESLYKFLTKQGYNIERTRIKRDWNPPIGKNSPTAREDYRRALEGETGKKMDQLRRALFKSDQ